ALPRDYGAVTDPQTDHSLDTLLMPANQKTPHPRRASFDWLFLDYLYSQFCCYFWMKLYSHLCYPKRTNRLFQLNFSSIQVNTMLFVKFSSNLFCCNRSKETATLPCFCSNRKSNFL